MTRFDDLIMKTTELARFRLIPHYARLLFFARNRFKGNNYERMREYFAQILIREIEEFMPLHNKRVLDVGGARGEFCRVISESRQCDAVNLDPAPMDPVWSKTVVGQAEAIPFQKDEFDLVICRGVLEHIPRERQLAAVKEMFRVTRQGGFSYIMIPPWYNPHAGHQLKPFHLLPFCLAKGLRRFFFHNKIEAGSLAEAELYPITFRRMHRMILASGFRVVATRDTHFRLHWLTRIPLLREILVPAVAFIVRKA